MTFQENQPVIASQTVAQNEAIENVLSRFQQKEIFIPPYQRDTDQWDRIKKSLFIESVLNRLTIPAFYLAASEENPEIAEVVDGQQRLATLTAFYNDQFTLCHSDECPYFGHSAHYAGKLYNQLDDAWQRAFRRYNLTLVSLPQSMDLNLRLEIFRRINEGGTPLSGQDIRLGYYSQSKSVRFIQAVGVFDPERQGSRRIIEDFGYPWPWSKFRKEAEEWKEWWEGKEIALGQKASEMFLWYLISNHRVELDSILADRDRLAANLKLTFRGNSDEVLDIACSQLQYENLQRNGPRILPSLNTLQNEDFPQFVGWWYRIRLNCGPSANVSKQRSIALLIPALSDTYGSRMPSDDQWMLIGRFLKSTRETARSILRIDFPEPRGRWKSQREQFDSFDEVVKEISNK